MSCGGDFGVASANSLPSGRCVAARRPRSSNRTWGAMGCSSGSAGRATKRNGATSAMPVRAFFVDGFALDHRRVEMPDLDGRPDDGLVDNAKRQILSSLTERSDRRVALKTRGGCVAGASRSVAHQTEEAVSRWMQNVTPSLLKPTYSPTRNELFSISTKVTERPPLPIDDREHSRLW